MTRYVALTKHGAPIVVVDAPFDSSARVYAMKHLPKGAYIVTEDRFLEPRRALEATFAKTMTAQEAAIAARGREPDLPVHTVDNLGELK